MATFKNVSGGPLDIPALDLHIAVDATFTVDDLAAEGFRNQPRWDEISPAPIVTPEIVPAAVPPVVAPVTPATPTDTAPVVTEIGA